MKITCHTMLFCLSRTYILYKSQAAFRLIKNFICLLCLGRNSKETVRKKAAAYISNSIEKI